MGLGRDGSGWLEVFDDAATGFAHARWLRTSWHGYNQSGSGETHPAIGNIDTDRGAEIVIGLSEVPGNGGWLEVIDDSYSGYVGRSWRNLGWESFRSGGGATYPAIGRFR